MEKGFDLCSGRDAKGRQWFTKLPVGVARTGMYVRLIGGVFLCIDRVETRGRLPANAPICTAAAVLQTVWEGSVHV